MTTQFFLLAGVALLAHATREDAPPPVLAPLAGASLGLALLARYDAMFFLAPLYAVLVWGMGPAGRTRQVLAALGVSAALLGQSWLHQRHFTPYYQPLGDWPARCFSPASSSSPSCCCSAGPRLADPRRRGCAARAFPVVRRRGPPRRLGALRLDRPAAPGGRRTARSPLPRRRGDPPGSPLARLLSGPESGNMLYLADILGALGLLVAVAGIAVLIVSRPRLTHTAWLAASVAMFVAVTLSVYHDIS